MAYPHIITTIDNHDNELIGSTSSHFGDNCRPLLFFSIWGRLDRIFDGHFFRVCKPGYLLSELSDCNLKLWLMMAIAAPL